MASFRSSLLIHSITFSRLVNSVIEYARAAHIATILIYSAQKSIKCFKLQSAIVMNAIWSVGDSGILVWPINGS